MAVIKSIPSQRIINGQVQETSEISIVSEAYYDTSGESCVVVKSVDNSKLRLNSTTTDHVVVKALTKVLIIPDVGKIDEVTKLPVHQCLMYLEYVKERNELENKMAKQALR